MTALYLELLGSRYRVRGPAAALGGLDHLFHATAIDRRPARAAGHAAAFRLESTAGGWLLIEEARAPGARDDELLGEFEEPVHALLRLEHALEERSLARLGTEVAVHAGAIALADGACLIAGGADAGKSSTTFHLAELGHPFVAEEIAALTPDRRVRPYPQSLALDPRVVAELPPAERAAHGELHPLDDILVRYLPRRAATEPVPLRTVVLPAYRPGQPARAEELSPESVLTELLGYCFEPAGGAEAAVDRMIELTANARLLRLRYPDAAAARRLLRELFGTGSG